MYSLSENRIKNAPDVLNRDFYSVMYCYENIRNEIKTKKYVVPKECRDNEIVCGFIEVMRLQKFRNLSFGQQEFYVRNFTRICEFVIKHPNQSRLDDIGFITPNYRNFLSNHKNGFSYGAIRRMISNCKNILVDICDPVNQFSSCSWWKEEIRDIKNNVSVLSREKGKPKDSLKDCFPESDYTDEQILISMRRVSLWFLNEINSIRSLIKGNHGLCKNILNTYDGLHYDNTSFSNYGRLIAPFVERFVGGELLEEVIGSKNLVAMEIMYYNPKRLYLELIESKKIESSENIIRGLNIRLKNQDKNCNSYIKNMVGEKRYIACEYMCEYFNKKYRATGLTSFSPLHIFSNTLAEEQVFQWFLASERIQTSGLERLKLSDVKFDTADISKSKQVQIKFYKGRGDKYYSTSIFNRNTPAFNAIRNYVNNEIEMTEKITGGVPRVGYLFQTRIKKLTRFSVQIANTSMLPIKLLGIKGTHMHSKCISEVEGAEAFLNVLERVNDSNAKRIKQSHDYDVLLSRSRKDKSIAISKKSTVMTERMLSVSLSSIAQSRALMESEDSDDDVRVTAVLSAHSEYTHNNSYADRYENIGKNPESKDFNFSARVGDEMVILAKKVAGFRAKVDLLNEQNINKRLGISYSLKMEIDDPVKFDVFLSDARLKGFEVGILGEISDETTTYIIQTPITCALILAYIDHIEKNIESVSVDNDRRAKLFDIHKIYLKDIVSRFPKKIVKKAKSLNIIFPFPEIL